MKKEKLKEKSFETDRIVSYFKAEWNVLLAVAVSGLIYNFGLLAGPWFEGRMTGCLVDILGGRSGFYDMLTLALTYVVVIGIVQASRYIKRFYVRRFANNVNRRMKHVLYGCLVPIPFQLFHNTVRCLNSCLNVFNRIVLMYMLEFIIKNLQLCTNFL